jgi:hypothetical protein
MSMMTRDILMAAIRAASVWLELGYWASEVYEMMAADHRDLRNVRVST